MVIIFEDIWNKQDDEIKLDEILELADEEWNTGIQEPNNDTWFTGQQVQDIWSVG